MEDTVSRRRWRGAGAAAAMALLLLGPPCVAAPATHGENAAAKSLPPPLRPGAEALVATALLHKTVHNAQDEELGTIRNLLLDRDGRISFVILAQGGVLGLGEDLYAIPWKALQVSPDGTTVTLDVARDRLAAEFSAFELGAFDQTPSPQRPAQPGSARQRSPAHTSTAPAPPPSSVPAAR